MLVSPDTCSGAVKDGGFNLQFAGSAHPGTPPPSSGCPGARGNPALQPLANNGGPTQTMALGAGSAAIDAGPSFPIVCPVTDQRGDLRPDASEQACDIGAFEFHDIRVIFCAACLFTAGGELGPRFFAVSAAAAEANGVTIRLELRKARTLVLLVRLVAARKLTVVGYVRLGQHPAGRSKFHWDLRVRGRLLPPGRYQLILYALDGDVLSLPASPNSRTLLVLRHGNVRVGR
jgi:hypothetical protein